MLRAPALLTESLGVAASPWLPTVWNSSLGDLLTSSGFCGYFTHIVHIHTYKQTTYTHKTHLNFNNNSNNSNNNNSTNNCSNNRTKWSSNILKHQGRAGKCGLRGSGSNGFIDKITTEFLVLTSLSSYAFYKN